MLNRTVILAGLSSLLSVSVFAASAFALGSNLRAPMNAGWGCETALIVDPIFGQPVFAPTNQTTCTIRNVGFLNSLRSGSYVPSNGFVTTVSIKSGNNPAPVRVTIMQCSPGRVGCTAKSMSRVLRPRPNRITTFTVNMRVIRSLSTDGGVTNITDAVALSAVGPGTIPISIQGTPGSFESGIPLSQFWWPMTQRGTLRNEDAYNMTGIELLLRWNFSRTNPGILR